MCIFCDIIDNKIPSKKIYEDNDLLVILDISQATRGHCLIMPKKHYQNILEMDDDIYIKMLLKVKELSLEIKNNLNAKGINILSNINEVAGQSVNHAHIHLLPRYEENELIIEFKHNNYNLDDILNDIKR